MSSFEECRELGNSAFRMNDYNKAISHYTAGLDFSPDNPILLMNRSLMYFNLHNYDASIADSTKVIDLDPMNQKAYYRKALALFEKGLYSEARTVLENYPERSKESIEIIQLRKEILKAPEEDRTYSSSSKFEKFVNWLIEGGGIFPKLRLHSFTNTHRGVTCISKISANEMILFIPKSHLITLDLAKDSQIGQEIQSNQDFSTLSPKHNFLTCFLLQELENPDSKWKPYLDILPTDYSAFPIFYTESEKELLTGSAFLDKLTEKIIDIDNDYKELVKNISSFNRFTLEEFRRLRMAVSSRIFAVEVNEQMTDCLVPFGDMLNHRLPRQTKWKYSNDKEGFVIEALEGIERSQEVMDSYGLKCNSRFLLNYGFVLPDNKNNDYPFILNLLHVHPLFNEKADLVREINQVFNLTASIKDIKFMQCLEIARLIVLDDLKVLQIIKERFIQDNAKLDGKNIMVISKENEIKALGEIRKVAEVNLLSYPRTIEEDQELLKGEISQNERNCLMMCIGEKKILEYFRKAADDLIEILSNGRAVARRKREEYREYLKMVVEIIN